MGAGFEEIQLTSCGVLETRNIRQLMCMICIRMYVIECVWVASECMRSSVCGLHQNVCDRVCVGCIRMYAIECVWVASECMCVWVASECM
jgi:hypothetical protein